MGWYGMINQDIKDGPAIRTAKHHCMESETVLQPFALK